MRTKMNQGYCDICEVETDDLTEIGKDYWLCPNCEHDFWRVHVDQKPFRFTRNVWKDNLIDPKKWNFTYKFRIGSWQRMIRFSGSDKVYRLVKIIEKPFWWLKRRFK